MVMKRCDNMAETQMSKTSLFSRLFSYEDLSQFGHLVEEILSTLYMSVCHCLLGAWCLVLGTWHHPKIVKYFHISHLFSGKDLSQFGHLVEESSSSTLLKLTCLIAVSMCLEWFALLITVSVNTIPQSTIMKM